MGVFRPPRGPHGAPRSHSRRPREQLLLFKQNQISLSLARPIVCSFTEGA